MCSSLAALRRVVHAHGRGGWFQGLPGWPPATSTTFLAVRPFHTLPPVRCQLPGPRSASQSPGGRNYVTLAGQVRQEMEVKHSKFVALAAPADSEEEALAFLAQMRDPGATHNCWAFKIGDRVRFSDDGEPGGTAGRPMHSAIVASGLDRVVVLVIRYFGGIKLGTGGLVRAYGGVTADCLKGAETIQHKAKIAVTVRAPYDLLGVIYSLLHSHGVQKVGEEYDDASNEGVSLQLLVEVDALQGLEKAFQDSGRGRARFEICTDEQ